MYPIKFLMLLTLIACGEFKTSPYTTNTEGLEKTKENDKVIRSITSIAKSSVQIALISDSHDYYDEFEKQVDYINMSNFDFVIHGGDVTNLGLKQEYEAFVEIKNRLNIPCLVVVGNHDLLTNGRILFEEIFGKEQDFSFYIEDVLFVVFNNNNWETTHRKVPDLSFIESILAKEKTEKVVFISHVQLDDTDRFSEKEIERMKELVNRFKVDYVISGHNHGPGDGTFGKATRYTIGASSKNIVLRMEIKNRNEISFKFEDI